MKAYFLVVFLVLVLSQANADQSKGKLKPEVGKDECEYCAINTSPANIWGAVWREGCKLDSQNRTIMEPARYVSRLKATSGLYDPCCTKYMGLVCRPSYRGKGIGYCGKPDPYQQDRGFGRDDHLSLIKAQKIADGQQLDNRWKNVD